MDAAATGPAAVAATSKFKQRKNAKRKERQKKAKEEKSIKRAKLSESSAESDTSAPPTPGGPDDFKVEVEYVVANPLEEFDSNSEVFSEYSDIFSKFTIPDTKEAIREAEEAAAREAKQKAEEDGDSAEAGEDGENDDMSELKKKLSKRQQRLQRRLSVAVLKQMVKKPELVEIWDTCAADPFLLSHLKAYHNVVPIPRHWSQRRKYLQGKRGVEKKPWELPHFIKETGIAEIRQAILEKEAKQKLKSKQRERLQPKLGKIDIDYEVLKDAFFRRQTKPAMSQVGDLYFESKEFEVKSKEKTPGHVSDDLKRALGMPPGAPPPWIVQMQRFGPPPSYARLKIPGVNAPIPPNGEWGYHPGGWGKPPVDEQGRPLWGWHEDLPPTPDLLAIDKKALWGTVAIEEESESEEEEMAVEGEDQEAGEEEEPAGQPLSEAEISRGLESAGLETPSDMQLRKFA